MVTVQALADSWLQKTPLTGPAREGPAGFVVNGKAYMGTGYMGPCLNDFWEYDPVVDAWTQKANYPGVVRNAAIGFAIGGKGYLGTGTSCGATPKRKSV